MSATRKKKTVGPVGATVPALRSAKLNLVHVKAAMVVMASRDIRYYLNGIKVEVRGSVVRIVGCDGHRMIVAQSEGAEAGNDADLIIPGDVLRLAMRVKRPKGFNVATLAEATGGEWFLRVCGVALGFKPIEGNFPKYAAVIPKQCSGKPAQFNGYYVADMRKAADILSPRSGWSATFIHHNGDDPALVSLPGDDAVGVLMPMRVVASPLPKWLAEVTG